MTAIEAIRSNAEVAVQKLGPLSGLGAAFGYNRESLEWVEGYIERVRSAGLLTDSDKVGNLSAVFGSFLGECVRANFGGEWRDHGGSWGVFFDDRNAVFPFSKVTKLIENGLEGGDSIVGLFDAIPEVLFKRPGV